MWETLNELFNKTNKKKIKNRLPKTFIKSDSLNIIEDLEIANKFNNYLINIGPNLAKEVKSNNNDTFHLSCFSANSAILAEH